MLKHLPEGLVPFENCGFARHPYAPMEGEDVVVDCRIDAGDGQPELLLSVNGAPEKPIAGQWLDGEHMRFTLGSFPFGAQVSYRMTTQSEATRCFSFETEQERCFSAPKAVFQEENAIHAAFDGFAVTFALEDGALKITTHTGKVSGTPCMKAEWRLPADFSLCVAATDSFWELKRFSKRIACVHAYSARVRKDGRITCLSLRGELNADYVWGAGERFDHVNLRGHGGNGRVVEKFTRQGDQSYLPIPFFMTENGLGWFREGYIPAAFRFMNGFSITQDTQGSLLTQDRLFFGKPAAVLDRFIRATGEPVCPPDWAFGLWMSANGWNCDREVDAQLMAMKQHNYPADVMVLEAWSDEQTFYRWNDDGSWHDPAATVRRIRQSGLHLLLWQIPVIKHQWEGTPCQALQDDIDEAVAKGYCVKNADGTPYRITEKWFHHSLLMDFTNPEAVSWWFGKRKYLLDMGVEGFKTDGGEFLFPNDARLSDGTVGLEAHNRYPADYIGAYHRFLRQNNVSGVTFSRADTTGAHTRPLHWAGDQLSTWSEMRAQLAAGISAGLSGVLFWGFDIGGFAGELPTAELYLRATAMGCFSPVMQWHAEPRSGQFYATHEDGFNNDRSPWNLAEKLNAPEVLTIATAYARLRKELKLYLAGEATHCTEVCRPMMAHLCLDFPDDPLALACEDEYMLGRRLLVAPVTEEGCEARAVYLPRGRWKDFFTGEDVAGGQTLRVRCPLEHIPVYERVDLYE